MEIVLNVAWALSSVGLFWMWMRRRADDRIPARMQLLALGMVMLLLLPVISLSDDLAARQGPAETDSCVRRSLHHDDCHPSVIPAALGMPEPDFAVLATGGWSQEALVAETELSRPTVLTRSLDSRPPPQA